MNHYSDLKHAIRILDRHRMDVLVDDWLRSTEAWRLLMHAGNYLRNQEAEEHKRAMREKEEGR